MPKDSREKNLYKAPYHDRLDYKIGMLKQYIDKNDVDLKKIFRSHDSDDNGYINYVQFDYIMTQFCKVDLEDLRVLRNFFDPSGTE